MGEPARKGIKVRIQSFKGKDAAPLKKERKTEHKLEGKKKERGHRAAWFRGSLQPSLPLGKLGDKTYTTWGEEREKDHG